MVLGFELVLLVVVIGIALRSPGALDAPFHRGLGVLRSIARRPHLAVGVAGLVGVLSSAGITLMRPVVPHAHDEFSYLLAADTFASGRITNPTPAGWNHFETFHVLQKPTYQSKYPPGQGLILALGQKLSGSPILGIWLASGLACAGVCWMLQAWLRAPLWAFLGGLLPAFRLGLFEPWMGFASTLYWHRGYWGGMLAVFGGALLFGALRRILASSEPRHAIILGVGALVLATTRPYEGFLACIPVALILFAWGVMGGRDGFLLRFWRVAVPTGCVLAIGLGALGSYNHRITGSATELPHVVYTRQYQVIHDFVWSDTNPAPDFRNAPMRDYADGFAARTLHEQKDFLGWLDHKSTALYQLWSFFLGPALTIPLLCLPWLLGDRWMQLALAMLGLSLVGHVVVAFSFPHYLAPVLPLLYVLVIQSLRKLRSFQPGGRPAGRTLVQGLAIVCVLSFLVGVARFGILYDRPDHPTVWARHRARIASEAAAQPGQHVIVVAYARTGHNVHHEWVSNSANLAAAKVIWARDLGAVRNLALRESYPGRHFWRVEADALHPILQKARIGPDGDQSS